MGGVVARRAIVMASTPFPPRTPTWFASAATLATLATPRGASPASTLPSTARFFSRLVRSIHWSPYDRVRVVDADP
jgi:hypothetical protein